MNTNIVIVKETTDLQIPGIIQCTRPGSNEARSEECRGVNPCQCHVEQRPRFKIEQGSVFNVQYGTGKPLKNDRALANDNLTGHIPMGSLLKIDPTQLSIYYFCTH